MQLNVINSNSEGNAYILQDQNEALLIEAGVNFDQIKKALNYNLRNVKGCIVTHEHGDHSKAMKQLMDSGINVYATDGTFRALNLHKHNRAITTFSGDEFKVGNFHIKAFDVQHDVAEPVGFLIWHKDTGLILFITDSNYCKYKFDGLQNIIIEANYCKTILDQRVQAGSSPAFLRDRVFQSHMSLQTCKSMLAANDLSQVKNIVLIHLSNGNSDAKRFKHEVEQQTGKMVHIASPGLIIPSFDYKPF